MRKFTFKVFFFFSQSLGSLIHPKYIGSSTWSNVLEGSSLDAFVHLGHLLLWGRCPRWQDHHCKQHQVHFFQSNDRGSKVTLSSVMTAPLRRGGVDYFQHLLLNILEHSKSCQKLGYQPVVYQQILSCPSFSIQSSVATPQWMQCAGQRAEFLAVRSSSILPSQGFFVSWEKE